MNETIMVSIGMATYNHGKFISQAIESVLMQTVNFKYQIIIGDDCSPDDTQAIIKEYAEKYPDIIKPILRTENVGATNNIKDIKMNCIGKYYITLEGDDYWTDSSKLQVQVDFLEKNIEYIGTTHWCDVVDEEDNISSVLKDKYKIFNMEKDEYTIDDFKRNRVPGHTSTLLYKNIYIESEFDYMKIFQMNPLVGDRTLYMILTLQGKIYCMHKIMSHYRYINKKGGTSYSSRVEGKNVYYDWFVYYSYLEKAAKEIMKKKITLRRIKYSTFLHSIIKAIDVPSDDNKKVVKAILKYSDEKVFMMVYCIIGLCIKKIQKMMM